MDNKTIELLANKLRLMPKLYPTKDDEQSSEYLKVMEEMFTKSLDKTIREFFNK